MKIHTSKTEFLESEIKRLRALVRAQQITIDKLEAQPAPVQEPVAWMEMVVANLVREGVNKHKARELAKHFYSLAQPALVQSCYCPNCEAMGKEIAALREQTAQPAPVQEPMHPDIKKLYEDYFDKCFRDSSSPQHPWVGLTDKELEEFSDAKLGSYDLCLEVEARLRSKNG